MIVLFAFLLIVVGAYAADPVSGDVIISPTSIMNNEPVTLRGMCSDADGVGDLTGCQFVDGISGVNIFPFGSLIARSATEAECIWQGTDLEGFTGDVEYQLACSDGTTTSLGVMNEDDALKRDTVLYGDLEVRRGQIRPLEVNFVQLDTHLSRRILGIYGDRGNGRPDSWEHDITTLLPSSPSTAEWYVCEDRVDDCGCAAKASGTSRSVQWVADASYRDVEFETLCWVHNELPELIQAVPNASWSKDGSNSSLTQLLDAFDLDDYFVDADGDTLSYSVTPTNYVDIVIDENNIVSFFEVADSSGTNIVYFTAIDDVGGETLSNSVKITIHERVGGGGPGPDPEPEEPPIAIIPPTLSISPTSLGIFVTETISIVASMPEWFDNVVTIFVDNVLIQTCDMAFVNLCSVLFDTTSVIDGFHSITAFAVYDGFTMGESDSIIVDNTPPEVYLDVPDEISYTDDLTILFTANDSIGLNTTTATFDNQTVENNETIVGLEPGEYTVTVTAQDYVRHTGGGSQTVTVVDDVAPVIVISSPVGEYDLSEIVPINVTVTDEKSGIDRFSYLVDFDPIGAPETLDMSFFGLGNHTFTVIAFDTAGNRAQESVTFTVVVTDEDGDGYAADVDCNDNDATINPGATEVCNAVDDNCDGDVDENDQEAPVTIPDIPSSNTGWRNTPLTVTFSAVDLPSGAGQCGVANVYFCDPVNSALGGTCIPEPQDGPLIFSDDGRYFAYYYSVDNIVGNREQTKIYRANIDSTPPVSTDDYDSEWHDDAVLVTFDASDNLSGLRELNYLINGVPGTLEGHLFSNPNLTSPSILFETEGVHSLGYYAVDNANNTGDVHETEVLIDGTAPETFDDYDGEWHADDLIIQLTSDDNASGVAEVHYVVNGGEEVVIIGSSADVAITTDGADNTLEYWAIDIAGNEEEHHIVSDIKIDTEAPTSSDDAPPGWQNQDVVVTIVYNDTLSGIAEGIYVLKSVEHRVTDTTVAIEFTEDGRHTIQHHAIDNAGNVGNYVQSTILIDKTAPVTTHTYDDEWHNDDITFALISDDGPFVLSGVESLYYSVNGEDVVSLDATNTTITITTEGADNFVRYWAVDGAGNVEEEQTLNGIKLDRTPPTIDVNIEDRVFLSSEPLDLDIQVDDELSGVAEILYFVDGGEVEDPTDVSAVAGTHTLRVVAVDYADNEAEDSAEFTVLLHLDNLFITPKSLKVNPGIITVHTGLSDVYENATIVEATLDGAPMDFVADTNIKFRRDEVEDYLDSVGEELDIHFEVRGILDHNGQNIPFAGSDDIDKILE